MQPGNGVLQRRGAAGRKQAVDVALFFFADDGVDGVAQQFRVPIHLLAVSGLAVEFLAQPLQRLSLSLAQKPHGIEQFLRGEVVTDHFAVLTQVHHVKRMQTILSVDVHALIYIAQHKYHPRRTSLGSRDYGVKSLRSPIAAVVFFHIVQKVEAKLVQSEIHDRDAGVHLLDVHDFFLQPFQLTPTVFQVNRIRLVDRIVIPCGRHDRDLHAGLDPLLEPDVVVESHVRPVIDQLDALVSAAYAVNSPETLDEPHGVPVNIVVDQIIAVLKVLALRNAVGGNQHVDLVVVVRKNQMFLLRNRREQRQYRVDVHAEFRHGGSAVRIAGDHRRVQTVPLGHVGAHVFVEVLRRIRKRGKDDDFLVAGVDRMGDFVVDTRQQVLQFVVVLRRDVLYHLDQQIKVFHILAQVFPPRNEIHVAEVDFDLASHAEEIVRILVGVQFRFFHKIGKFKEIGIPDFFIAVDGANGLYVQFADPLQCLPKRIDRTFQPLQQSDAHQMVDALLPSEL